MNIEGLRPGGLPAPLPPEPAGISFFEWPENDEEGWRPDDPVTAKLGEGVFLHRYADIRTCSCGSEFISAGYLEAHRRSEHGRADE